MMNIDSKSPLLDTILPLALLPIRIETRFVSEAGASSLLVRIFPDEVHIDRQGTFPPRARLLPNAFIVLGYADKTPTAPNLAATPAGALFAVQGNAILEDPPLAPDPNTTGHDPLDPGSRWLRDFDDAEKRGLAIRIPIDATIAQRGLAQLIVLGVRRGDEAERFADLLAAHGQSDGLGLVPCGTPTNNTSNAPSGWTSEAEPPHVASVATDSDGALADQALGLPTSLLASVPNGNSRQIVGGRGMNTLLWPATWGYFLEQMMAGAVNHQTLLSPSALSWARAHFKSFVRPDGPLPTVRIGRQPYGLLPVTSLAGWPLDDQSEPLARLLRSLRDRLFRPAAVGLLHLVPGQPDLDRAVGDLLAHQPHAWRYSGRSLFGAQYARTLFAMMRWPPTPPRSEPSLHFFKQPPPPEEDELVRGWKLQRAVATPAQLTWTGDEQLLSQFFFEREAAASKLVRDVLVDVGLSGRPRLGCAMFIDAPFPIDKLVGDESYLVALSAETKTFAALRNEKPAALLDQLARHALLLEGAIAAGRRSWVEPELFNVAVPAAGEKPLSDVWSVLGSRTIAEMARSPGAGELSEMREALTQMSGLSFDELTRLLTGTLDTCSHRIDAWITSLAQRRLTERRQASPKGLYLGAYGWVLNLRPQTAAQVVTDEHVLAPSLDHAVTGAILRAGYQAHRAGGDGAMAVDLSSTRVRLALWLLDGVRQGQPLGALLGYRFERGLQERSQPGHLLGPYIEPFRRLAPLECNLNSSGVTESTAAHDVVDGLALSRIYQQNRDARIPLPFGVTATFEARVRVDRIDADLAAIAAKMDQSTESEYLFAVRTDLRVVLAWHTEGGMTFGTPAFNLAASTQQVPLGQWVHLAAVREGPTIRFYINGKEAGSSTPADNKPFRPSAKKLSLRIGAERPGIRTFVGRIREVRLWSIAQAPEDLPDLARGPLNGPAPGLAAYWRFEEGREDSVADCSPYRRNGTIRGGTNPPWVQVHHDEDPFWGDGPALELNGTQFVEVPHAPNLSLAAVEGLPASGVEQILITAELDALCDAVDALSDLTLAESVHHVALGNPSRAGAVLDALSRGEVPPPELEVARTPQSVVVHAHRLAVFLGDGGTQANAWSTDPSRLRPAVEPLLNEWAATILRRPGRVHYRCEYLDAGGAVVAAPEYALDESGLALSPLDIVYSSPGKGDPGFGELEQRLRYQRLQRPPAGIVWSSLRLNLSRQPKWPADQLSVPELLEVAAALRRVFDQARPLAGADLLATGELDIVDTANLKQRAQLATNALAARKTALTAAGTNLAKLRQALLAASFAGVTGAVPGSIGNGDEDRAALIDQARATSDEIDRRLSRAASAPDDMSRLTELFAGNQRIVPRLLLTDELRAGLRAAFREGGSEPAWSHATLNAEVWSWLSRLARVRDAVGRLDDLLLYEAALNSSASSWRVAQLPAIDGEAWIGLADRAASLTGGRVSVVACLPGRLDLERLAGGLIIDQWTESVPRPTHTAGLAFRVDAPGAAPPQAILLAVPNDKRPQWDLAALEGVLLETLELARLRMVGPGDLGPANHFLPATFIALNAAGDTVSTDLVGEEI
jgi:hypothetical protein